MTYNRVFSNEIEIDDGSYIPFSFSQLKTPFMLIGVGILIGIIITHYI